MRPGFPVPHVRRHAKQDPNLLEINSNNISYQPTWRFDDNRWKRGRPWWEINGWGSRLYPSTFPKKKGPKHWGLTRMIPSQRLFDRLLYYRYYRLSRTTATNINQSTLLPRKNFHSLELTLNELKFTGEDPIHIFDFLTRFVEKPIYSASMKDRWLYYSHKSLLRIMENNILPARMDPVSELAEQCFTDPK